MDEGALNLLACFVLLCTATVIIGILASYEWGMTVILVVVTAVLAVGWCWAVVWAAARFATFF